MINLNNTPPVEMKNPADEEETCVKNGRTPITDILCSFLYHTVLFYTGACFEKKLVKTHFSVGCELGPNTFVLVLKQFQHKNVSTLLNIS